MAISQSSLALFVAGALFLSTPPPRAVVNSSDKLVAVQLLHVHLKILRRAVRKFLPQHLQVFGLREFCFPVEGRRAGWPCGLPSPSPRRPFISSSSRYIQVARMLDGTAHVVDPLILRDGGLISRVPCTLPPLSRVKIRPCAGADFPNAITVTMLGATSSSPSRRSSARQDQCAQRWSLTSQLVRRP